MTNNPQALIVDDEPDILELVSLTLERMSIDAIRAESLNAAKNILTRRHIDLCLTDMNLGDGSGIELVEHIQNEFPNIPVAVITAFGNVETAVTALKAGAFDYVAKPVDINILRTLVQSAVKLSKQPSHKNDHKLLGESEVIIELRKTIEKLARSQAPIYINGPSGSGKELVARLIHEQGPRSDKPFVPVNCGAIPSELLESEFFGHSKGSFTGANTDKEGLFTAANGGTLFLDEIADLPQAMQVKLLRAIQEKSIRPVGKTQEINVDVRIISATHHNLEKRIEDNLFREDLYYRINVIMLNIPSLAQRKTDIPLLAQHILEKLNRQNSSQVSLSQAAIKTLSGYHFPGNIRELENILQRAATLCDGHEIGSDDLQLPIGKEQSPMAKSENLTPYLNEVEKDAIVAALEETKWNKTAAAKKLGITFRALRYRMKKLDLD